MNASADTSATETTPLAVRCVRALLERHGLPKYRQSAWLAEAMGLSYAQAHRRMSGAASWTLEELERLATLFGESLGEVVGSAEARASVPALMQLGASSVPCELWLGDELRNPDPDSVVAVHTSEGWAAVCAGEVGDRTPYAVERLQARPVAAQRKVVAVLDDDRDLTDSICAHLQASGYDARGFYRSEDLQTSIEAAQRHDAFVIDWIVGETSTAKLIASLRSRDAACPILVLTAQVVSGMVPESEIAAAVADYNLVFSEKPVRMAILSASLSRALAAR